MRVGYYSFIKDYGEKAKKNLLLYEYTGQRILMFVDEEGHHLIPNHTPGI